MSSSTSSSEVVEVPVNVHAPKNLNIVKLKYTLVPNRSDIKYTKMKESVYIPPSSDVENMILDLKQHKDCHISLPYGNFTMKEVMNFKAILTAANIIFKKKITKNTKSNINNKGLLDACKHNLNNIPQNGKETSKMLDILKAAQLQLNVDKVVQLHGNKSKELQHQPLVTKADKLTPQSNLTALQLQPKDVQLQTIVKTVQLQPTVAKQPSVTETDQTTLKSVIKNDFRLEKKIAYTSQSTLQPNVTGTAQTILHINDVLLEQNIANTSQSTSQPNVADTAQSTSQPNVTRTSQSTSQPNVTNISEATGLDTQSNITKAVKLKLQQKVKLNKLSTLIEETNKVQLKFHIEHLRSFVEWHPSIVFRKDRSILRLKLVLKAPNGLVPVYKSFKCTKEGREDKQAIQNIHEFLASSDCLKWIKQKINCSEDKQALPLIPVTETSKTILHSVRLEQNIANISQSISQPNVANTAQSTSEPYVTWTAQSTSQPNVAKAAQLTSQPNVANTAQSTLQPNVTNTAELTSEPDVTNTAQSTLQPNVTNTAQLTSQPDVTNTSHSTSQPDVTNTSHSTSQPNVTNTSHSTSQPNVTGTARSTSQHNVANTSHSTSQPNVTGTSQSTSQPNVAKAAQLTSQSNASETVIINDIRSGLNVTKTTKLSLQQHINSIVSENESVLEFISQPNTSMSEAATCSFDTSSNINDAVKLKLQQKLKINNTLPSTPKKQTEKAQPLKFHIEHLRSFVKGQPRIVFEKERLILSLRLVLKAPNGLVHTNKSFKCTKEGRQDKQAIQNIHEFLASSECLKWIKKKIKCSEEKQTLTLPLTPELERYLSKEPTIRYQKYTQTIQVDFSLKVGYTFTQRILCSSEGIKDKDAMEIIRSFIYGDEALTLIQDKLLCYEKNGTGTRLWQNNGQVGVGTETKYYFDKFKFDFCKRFKLKPGVKSYYPDSVSIQENATCGKGKARRFDEVYKLPEGVELENDVIVVSVLIKCCSQSSVCRTRCRKAFIKDIVPLLNGESIACPGCQKVCPYEKSECFNCFVETSPTWNHMDKKIFCNRCFRYFKRNQVMPPPTHQPRSDKKINLLNYKHFTCGWEQKLIIFSQDLTVWQIYDKISNEQFHPNKVIGSERSRPNLSTKDATETEILSTTDDQSNLLMSNNSSIIFSNLKPTFNKNQLKKKSNGVKLINKRERQKELEIGLEQPASVDSVLIVESSTKVVENMKSILCLTCIGDNITPPYTCGTRNELTKHVVAEHKLICCSQCYLEKKIVLKFKTEGQLKRHLRAKHSKPGLNNIAAGSDTSCLSDSSNVFVNKTQTSNNLNNTISTGYSSTSASGDILDLMNSTSVSLADNPCRKRKNANAGSVVTPTKKRNYFCPVCDFQCDCSLPTILCNTCKHMFHWHCVTVTSDLLNWNCQNCSLL